MATPQSAATKRSFNAAPGASYIYSNKNVASTATPKATVTTTAGTANVVPSATSSKKTSSGSSNISTSVTASIPPSVPLIPTDYTQHSYSTDFKGFIQGSNSGIFGMYTKNVVGTNVVKVSYFNNGPANMADIKIKPKKKKEDDLPPASPSRYKWNLPPHKWSMPLLPSADRKFMPEGYSRMASDDKYRRGRIWFRQSADVTYIQGDVKSKASAIKAQESRNYGFQFLWNPEMFNTNVAVNLEVTPDVSDKWLGAAGLFQSTENISFTIRLDRTNDFACAAALLKRPTNLVKNTTALTGFADSRTIESAFKLAEYGNSFVSTAVTSQFVDYYKVPTGFISNDGVPEIAKKLKDLLERGTLADIEFLYRAINGNGPSDGVEWRSPRGIATAAVGYLMPTSLNIDIGPLSYVGWATNLEISHIGFTQDMIPIRSDVTISFNLLTTAGVTTNQPAGG